MGDKWGVVIGNFVFREFLGIEEMVKKWKIVEKVNLVILLKFGMCLGGEGRVG